MQNYVPRLDHKLLSAFVAAAESGSFLQAGQRLNKSKSTISRWIKELETQLGYELFHKRPNGSVLEINKNGRRLLPKTKALMASTWRLEKFSFSLAQADVPDTLRLAFNALIPTSSIAAILLKFKAEFPNTDLQIIPTDLYDVEEVLKTKRADFVLGLATTAVPAGLKGCAVGTVRTQFITNHQHRLAKQRAVNGLQLSAETLILPSFTERGQTMQHPQIPAYEIIQVTDYLLGLALAERGVGIAYVPEHIASPWLQSQRVCSLDVDANEFGQEHPLMLFCRESSTRGAIYPLLVDCLM
ncbi:MAG: LysR family transcriptional regulator [Yokenella regensburgei]|jgi:DNA-binding transcriptional LysR family regulator|uniref:LysR family transcriptional regulator n=1 Tax=Yokenella regensburgei TaxID=158877 RepID=UPI001375C60F|nr:LysR family transcriptional regulator [Yokenella regensburgei]KAF1370423.1 DNA-binding transcriptional LysR family regulator [Yokenella regensburgei]MDQ4430261.1 LysR family transcriptional regulator [Yokenella regensburgei]MDR3106085.1 LysR family transcriptional regulator [Yokenella regensburgei]QIU90126.1 LysR family transcriptional regulator [Yokenella regensburgei]